MVITVRLSDAEAASVRASAARQGRSVQDVARAAIQQYVARRSMVDEILRTIVADDRELVDRLVR